MTKSRKKRPYFLVRKIEELGPNFYSNLRAGLLSQYKYSLRQLNNRFDFLHESILTNPKDEIRGAGHTQLERLKIVEIITLIDYYINQALSIFQERKLNIPGDKINFYLKAEEGIDKCLSELKFPSDLDSSRSKIKHFRTFRNQFAHYQLGMFFFEAKHESFESFIQKLEGIELGEDLWCYINGKAGVAINYQITSGKFNDELVNESQKYIEQLLELMFAD